MSEPLDPLDPLIADLLEWVARAPRTRAEAIKVWRTSCPRLPVWEEAADRGLLIPEPIPGGGDRITVTAAGWRFLAATGRMVSR
jgi:hypothetical protein